MLITQDEFIDRCSELNISTIKIGYFLKSGIIPMPISFTLKGGIEKWIFDERDLKMLKDVLALYANSSPQELFSQRATEDSYADLLSQSIGVSQGVLELYKHQFAATSNVDIIKKINIIDFLESQFAKKKKKVFSDRFASFILKLRTINIRLTGTEQLDLITKLAITQVSLPYIMADKLYHKIGPFPLTDLKYMMLRTYTENYGKVGWNILRNELEFFNSLSKIDPNLLTMPIRQVLSILDDLEKEYRTLVEKAFKYLKTIDPENYLTRLIAYDLIMPYFSDFIEKKFNAKADRKRSKFPQLLSKVIEIVIRYMLPK
jgi:hypothetical protein